MKLSNTKDYNALVINDIIHGSISFSSLIKSFIDTEQFQRLRNIKQLGISQFVYTSAVHSRFEHSIGTAYLCSTFLKILKDRLKKTIISQNLNEKFNEEIITEEEIICVELAGLLHDLGHGPFSHMFDSLDSTNTWTHEQMSCNMIDYLIESNPIIQDQLKIYNITSKHIKLIKQLIIGVYPLNDDENLNNKDENIIPFLTYKNDQNNQNIQNLKIKKWFLFQIVSNKFTGVDCDKFDYMLRDSYYVGVNCNFDYKLYFQNCQLLQTTIDGIHISPRDKQLLNINELFYSRWRLHRTVYRHKTVKPIELMLIKALKISDKFFNISESMFCPFLFCKLTDHIFYQILYSNNSELKDAQNILKNILKRNIPKLCGQVTLPSDFSFENKSSTINFSPYLKSLDNSLNFKSKLNQQIINEIIYFDTIHSLNPNFIHVDIIEISSGMNIDNPINRITFHTKNSHLAHLRSHYISNMIPKNFSDKVLRVYYGSLSGDSLFCENQFNTAVSCFQNWCLSYNFPLSHTVSLDDNTGYFTQIPNEKRFESSSIKRFHSNSQCNSNCQCDDKIKKKLKF